MTDWINKRTKLDLYFPKYSYISSADPQNDLGKGQFSIPVPKKVKAKEKVQKQMDNSYSSAN